MALLAVKHRKAIFQYLGLGEYNRKSIKAFQKAYMFREKDWDGIYGQDTDNALRTVYFTLRYTKNFSPKEFRCECGGKYCCGYPSFMKPAQLIHIQAIRDKYGKPITITSGLRCKKQNQKLGGSIQNSLHMSGQALDFYQEGVTDTLKNRKATAKWIRKQKNHHYTYGNGIYWLTTDDGASTGSVSAPYMGNALHTDTYNNVKPTYPKYTETPKVIDISNFQDTIDFAKVKADGIKGVIAKCGYRGAETGKLADDSRFLEHIKGAYKAGLAVGIYVFTQAITTAEAKAEADYAIKRWKQAGVPVSFPIAIDTENVFYEKDGKRVAGRANGLSKAKRTAVVKAFCERIVELGHEPMIYASTSWLNSKLDMSKLPYKVWVAQYADECEYKGEYILWQYTSKGDVNGVKGNVDMNYCYIDLIEVPCPKEEGPLQPWFDAMEEQYEWSKNQKYKFNTSPNVANSEKEGTCITFIAVSLQRLKLLPKNKFFYLYPKTDKIAGNGASYVKKHPEIYEVKYPNKTIAELWKKGEIKVGDICGYDDPGYHSMVFMGFNSKGEPLFNTMGHKRGLKVTYPSYADRKVGMLTRLKKVSAQ